MIPCLSILEPLRLSSYNLQVGVADIDNSCWMRPEDMEAWQRPTPFPCEATHPCSDLAAEMAAALAASSIIFRQDNTVYADQILHKAENLFKFAITYKGKYSDWVLEARPMYNSTRYEDEIYWAACWLYFASGDAYYLNTFLLNNAALYQELYPNGTLPTAFNWDTKTAGVAVGVRLMSI